MSEHEHTWQTTEAICRCGQVARVVVLRDDFDSWEAFERYLEQRVEVDRRRFQITRESAEFETAFADDLLMD